MLWEAEPGHGEFQAGEVRLQREIGHMGSLADKVRELARLLRKAFHAGGSGRYEEAGVTGMETVRSSQASRTIVGALHLITRGIGSCCRAPSRAGISSDLSVTGITLLCISGSEVEPRRELV